MNVKQSITIIFKPGLRLGNINQQEVDCKPNYVLCRSPTHQIQIYNQYGQFVRKFGANILQHPRGVCVDNKGRIIVVECKVIIASSSRSIPINSQATYPAFCIDSHLKDNFTVS